MLLLEPVLVLLLLFARPLLNILRTVNSRLFHIFWAKQAKQEVEDGWWLGGERGGGGNNNRRTFLHSFVNRGGGYLNWDFLIQIAFSLFKWGFAGIP